MASLESVPKPEMLLLTPTIQFAYTHVSHLVEFLSVITATTGDTALSVLSGRPNLRVIIMQSNQTYQGRDIAEVIFCA